VRPPPCDECDELLGVLARVRARHGGPARYLRVLAGGGDRIDIVGGGDAENKPLGAQGDGFHRISVEARSIGFERGRAPSESEEGRADAALVAAWRRRLAAGVRALRGHLLPGAAAELVG